jgi:hypothetical protein
MKPLISSIEIENRVIVAKYQRLMVGAKVVLVEKASGRQLPETVTRVASPVPVGALRIRLPDAIAWRGRRSKRGLRDQLSRWIFTISGLCALAPN